MREHEGWMKEALREAEKAYALGEVPVGAVVVYNRRVIGRGHNQTETLQDPTAHAEMIAISAAANTLKSWRLEDCLLYVTLEPCAMCAGAVVLSRMAHVYLGADDPKAGACGSLRNIVQDPKLNHRAGLTRGILARDSAAMLRSFFQKVRSSRQFSNPSSHLDDPQID